MDRAARRHARSLPLPSAVRASARSLCMVMALLGAGRARGEAAKSLLVNGDFETGAGDDVPGWARAFYPQVDGINRCIGVSHERAKSGQQSLKIDTGPVLGEETTLVFNGAVSREATALRGRTLALSGWVYVEPGTAVRPIAVRLRAFERDQEGNSHFLRDVFEGTIFGSSGEWVSFRFSGEVPDTAITHMDLHCGLRPDTVRTVQFLDSLRLEEVVRPLLEVRLLRDAVWRDEERLPVEVRLKEAPSRAAALDFRLLDSQHREVATWRREPQAAILGLDLPKAPLLEGRYVLRADLRYASRVFPAEPATLEVVESPWRDAPAVAPPGAFRATPGEPPEGFRVLGTMAPTGAADADAPRPEDESPDVELREARARGYGVFSRHWLDPVSRQGRPRPGEMGRLRLLGCPGEYEPAAISVWAIRPQKAVQVRVGDLAGPQGSVAASNTDVRVVRTLRGLPAFLEKRSSVDIPEGRTQTFWLTVRVPPDAAPGFYRGWIEVAPQGGRSLRRELLLRVLPLKLPPPQKGYGFWWTMDRRWNGYYSKERDVALEQIRKQFILLREHHCNMVSCYSLPKMTKQEDGSVALDFAQDHWGYNAYSMADFFRLGKQTGLSSPRVPIQYAGADLLHTDWIARSLRIAPDDLAFDEFYRDACRRVDRWAKDQGLTLAFACVDEIGNSPEGRQAALRFYRDAHESGVLTSVTDNSMHGGVHLMGQPRFDEIIAMRLYNFITPEMIEHTRHSGDALWLYNLASGGWDPRRERFVFGLFTERCGADGCAQWAFQWPHGATDPYQAAAEDLKDAYHYALPAADGPLPTLALEGVRAGIDDARYLALLPAAARDAHLKDITPLSFTIPEQLAGHCGTLFDARRWRIARDALQSRPH